MTRQATLVTILGAVLIVVLFFFLVFQPRQGDIADLEQQAADVRTQQDALEAKIASLRAVRSQAPEYEAAIAAAETVIPGDAALPAAVRQFQMAADDSGGELVTVAMSRPTAVEGDVDGLAELEVSMTFEAGYFQTVDFLRRIEDPAITPRALLWKSLTVASEEYPTLTTSLSGTIFAVLPPGVELDEGAEDGAATDPAESGSDAPGEAPSDGPSENPSDPPAAPEGDGDIVTQPDPSSPAEELS
jgi:Tfp pilus assembly protein PilO